VRPRLSARTSSRRHRIDTRYTAAGIGRNFPAASSSTSHPSCRRGRTEIRRGRCQ
jgi:hypothetical protein